MWIGIRQSTTKYSRELLQLDLVVEFLLRLNLSLNINVELAQRRNLSLCVQIRGFPTIKIFRKGEEPEDYQGGRSRGDIIERAMDLFSDNAPAPEIVEVSAVWCRVSAASLVWMRTNESLEMKHKQPWLHPLLYLYSLYLHECYAWAVARAPQLNRQKKVKLTHSDSLHCISKCVVNICVSDPQWRHPEKDVWGQSAVYNRRPATHPGHRLGQTHLKLSVFVLHTIIILSSLITHRPLLLVSPQVQLVGTDMWRWWWRWLRNTRRRCGGEDESRTSLIIFNPVTNTDCV